VEKEPKLIEKTVVVERIVERVVPADAGKQPI
jgi:hypothetical protein